MLKTLCCRKLNIIRFEFKPAMVSGNQLTLTSIGHVSVLASQLGNADYEPVDFEQTFNITGNYATWVQSQFTVSELADPNISGPNAVASLDGFPNLVKYALGLTAKVPATSGGTLGPPQTSVISTDWAFDFWHPSSIIDVTYEVEVSSNLSTWTTTGVTLVHVNTLGPNELWRAKYPLSSATTVYFRLKITQPVGQVQ